MRPLRARLGDWWRGMTGADSRAPAAPARVTTLQWRALGTVWTDARVRSSVLGYFGHMWELYTLWVLVPVILAPRLQGAALSWAAFAVLGAGAAGCVLGGRAAQRWGSARVAWAQLATSGACGLAAPEPSRRFRPICRRHGRRKHRLRSPGCALPSPVPSVR